MKRAHSTVLLLAMFCGCQSEPKADPIVPIDQVPPKVMEAASKQLPGFTFDTVYKMEIEGEVAYEVRGKDSRGKVREVEVSASGEVLAVE